MSWYTRRNPVLVTVPRWSMILSPLPSNLPVQRSYHFTLYCVGADAADSLAARLILLATVPRIVFLLFNGIYFGIINDTDNKVFVRDANDAPHTTALVVTFTRQLYVALPKIEFLLLPIRKNQIFPFPCSS